LIERLGLFYTMDEIMEPWDVEDEVHEERYDELVE
jgi:hypothetical protein